MPLPLEDHVRVVLIENERGEKFYRAINEAWDELRTKYPERATWRRKSSARHMMWELVAKRLIAVVDEDDGLEAIFHQDTISIIADDEVLFRLKHADLTLATRNFPTAEAVQYDDHDVDLFGRSGLQRVKLCYVPDEYEAALIWVGIAASSNGQLLWRIELNDEGAIASEQRLPFNQPEVDTTRLARIKNPETGKLQNKKKDNG